MYTVHNPANDVRTTLTLNIAGKIHPGVLLKGYSKSYECIVVEDDTPSVNLYKFTTADDPTPFATLNPSILADGTAISAVQSYQVAKDCGALVIKTASAYSSYHWNALTPAY